MDNFKKYCFAAVLAGALYLGAAQTLSAQTLVANGLFDTYNIDSTTVTNTKGGQITNGYTGTTNYVNLPGWSTTGYNFVFLNGNKGDVSVTGSDGALALYGPANGQANGLVLPPAGNPIAADGAYEVAPITQTVNGLTNGTKYVLTFYWAGAQQTTYTGTTTEQWSYALYAGGTVSGVQKTTIATVPQGGFSGWQLQAFTFTASASSETLYFLANGTPTGQPPFAMLADVALVPVPEPKATAAFSLLFVMLIMGGTWIRRRHQENLSS